jgi:hypothetical protein
MTVKEERSIGCSIILTALPEAGNEGILRPMGHSSAQVMDGARRLRDHSANTLSTIVRIPSFSGKEESVCRKIASLCA